MYSYILDWGTLVSQKYAGGGCWMKFYVHEKPLYIWLLRFCTILLKSKMVNVHNCLLLCNKIYYYRNFFDIFWSGETFKCLFQNYKIFIRMANCLKLKYFFGYKERNVFEVIKLSLRRSHPSHFLRLRLSRYISFCTCTDLEKAYIQVFRMTSKLFIHLP